MTNASTTFLFGLDLEGQRAALPSLFPKLDGPDIELSEAEVWLFGAVQYTKKKGQLLPFLLRLNALPNESPLYAPISAMDLSDATHEIVSSEIRNALAAGTMLASVVPNDEELMSALEGYPIDGDAVSVSLFVTPRLDCDQLVVLETRNGHHFAFRQDLSHLAPKKPRATSARFAPVPKKRRKQSNDRRKARSARKRARK